VSGWPRGPRAAPPARAVAGVGQLATDASERASIRSRNALELAERRDRRLTTRMDAAFRRTTPGRAVSHHLASAGVTWRPLSFVGLMAVSGTAGFLMTRSLLPLWLAVPAGLGAAYGVWSYVERIRRRRRERFLAQLPDIARMISSGSQAGLSLLSAIELAATDLDDPAGEELQRVASQIRLGQDLETALKALVERMPSRDVGVMVSTLIIQQRAGGDVVAALSDLSAALDARRQTARDVRVMLVGAVFTSYVIPVLVLGLLLLLNLSSPGALDELTSSFFGRVVLVVSGSLTAIGYAMIRRITKVET
jgi:tight adherence protein B